MLEDVLKFSQHDLTVEDIFINQDGDVVIDVSFVPTPALPKETVDLALRYSRNFEKGDLDLEVVGKGED